VVKIVAANIFESFITCQHLRLHFFLEDLVKKINFGLICFLEGSNVPMSLRSLVCFLFLFFGLGLDTPLLML
jgi:hypothetical protein